jgi:DNA-binding protein H-NS
MWFCMMKRLAGKSLSLAELGTLRDQVRDILLVRMTEKKRTLEARLRLLERPGKKRARRPYPKVLPKFKNPDLPSQTWAGRGKQPRWLAAQLRSGKQMNDFLIHS